MEPAAQTALLQDKQRLFCKEYLVDLNATEAAKRAGYLESSARKTGSRLLADERIQAYIAELKQERSRRLNITQDAVLQELAAIAFARCTDFCEVVKRGNKNVLQIKPIADLTERQKAAVVTIKTHARGGIEVKLADKMAALELLGKHLGIFDGSGRELDKIIFTFNRE